jgi:hypothetical protein
MVPPSRPGQRIAGRTAKYLWLGSPGIACVAGWDTGELTNLSTGKTLRDHASFSDAFDFIGGTLTETGVSFHYKIPHQSLVVTLAACR